MHKTGIRLGIVGCGQVAEHWHIPAVLAARGLDLTAVVDSSSERLDRIVDSFGLSCLATTSGEEILGRVDAVLLALPNHLHYPAASQFLSEGVHVLCEKPLANTAREARELCELAEARGLVLAVGYMKQFEPNCDLMKQLVEEGFLGRLDHFEFEYGTDGGWAPLSSYNLFRDQAGGGVLVTTGAHFLDRMLYWFGYPSGISFKDDSHGGVEANCTATFTFASGLVGDVTLSKTHVLRNRFRLHGERGFIEIAHSQHGSVTFLPVDGDARQHEISERPTAGELSDAQYFQCQVEDFARAVQSRTPPRVTGRQGLASVELIEECYAARSPLPESWLVDLLPRLQQEKNHRTESTAIGNRQCPPAHVNGSAVAASRAVADTAGMPPNVAETFLPQATGSRRGYAQPRQTVFVTGSTGFVGSRLCEVLYSSLDYEPRPFVHSSGTSSYIARYPLRPAMGDLTDWSSIRRGMVGCSFVVHLARGSKRVMINGLKNVLRAAAETGVRRFIHVSSVAVYGDDPPQSARSETAPARKTGNPYGDLKLEQEDLVASYCRRTGLPFVILRPPHIFGPFSHFVRAVTRGLLTKTLPIVEDGANVCNLVYIDNLIEALVLSLEREEAIGEIFFIVDKERVVWRKCLEDLGAMLGLSIPHAADDQLALPPFPGAGDSFRAIARIVASPEFRSALLGMPGLRTAGRVLVDGYAALSEKQQSYLRRRFTAGSVRSSRSVTLPLYNGGDYLIMSQRRRVVHASDKAERLLGYTAAVGYVEAMAMTKHWVRFAKIS